MSSVETIVSVRDVVNRFGAQVVHDGVSLDVYKGEVFGIVGGSGSGKSVLLRTMLGLRPPDGGTVEVEGRDIARMQPAELRESKRRYGVAFQHGALFSSLSVAENLTLPVAEAMDLEEDVYTALVGLRLRMVGLPPDTAAKFPAQLSGGMVKRVALARALALDPVLLFLDEPTAGLDPIAASEFDELVIYLRRALELTIVMVTHDLDTLSRTCDRVAVLVDRRVIVDTLPRIKDHEHPWIREYFNGPRGRRAAASEPGVGA